MKVLKTKLLRRIPMWLLRILLKHEWFINHFVGPEPPPPTDATEKLIFRSREHPTWGMLAFRMPDGKLYLPKSTKPWEPTIDWELELREKL